MEEFGYMEIKIIRLGEPEVPFDHFDAAVEPLTQQELAHIHTSAKEALVVMFGDDTIKLNDEYVSLQKQISRDKIHETKSPENTKIIMRVKEIKSELKKRGYFR